ncbi:uncharacterized protein ACA1_384040 [Acanthamoeba castellanii str. Neff]|uniref:MIT domain containing protein n=1 Tax=Acanthamoeba castellanii (strain ATCC 30010 / Neff) TaxID=1257118 RepID=L8HBD7_ACACF|nr:uncharacterized protein ACA1_384040 [Acanthamoeba castellanii str. Neff]ELR21701.1 hypothetical protein ACA1_384040 [Acanthamoeba castellanii str. Neff]
MDAQVQRITNALALARVAVEADRNAEYVSALWKYKELVVALEAEQAHLPAEVRPAAAERIARYRARAVALEKCIPKKAARPGSNFASRGIGTLVRKEVAKVNFVEEMIHPATAKMMEAPPISNLARPFWLIKVLNTTITTGGFITPKLYISRTEPARRQIHGVQQKIAGLQTLLEALSKLSPNDSSNKDFFIRQLEELCSVLDSVQSGLSRHLAFIKSKEGSILKGMARGAGLLKTGLAGGQMDDSYVQLLSQTFQKATYFENWIVQWEKGAKEVVDLLKRVSDFFYNVILAFAIRHGHLTRPTRAVDVMTNHDWLR